MNISHSKQRILDEALKLFSTSGYEATSNSQITDAVGIKKSSLYSHFQSKQEIFDTLIDELTTIYEENSLFAKVNWNNEAEDYTEFVTFSEDDISRLIIEQLVAIIHDPYISRMRKLLTIEQFRNPQLCAMQN